MWAMRDVDAFGVWNMGRTVFLVWFAAAVSTANILFLRISTRLSVRKFIVILIKSARSGGRIKSSRYGDSRVGLGFVAAQLAGAFVATALFSWLAPAAC